MEDNNERKYEDIMHCCRPVSGDHPPMPLAERAAQFAPFAALTGHGEAIKEAARMTNRRIDLDEDMKACLDIKFQRLREQVRNRPEIEITYFKPDSKKTGGLYKTIRGCVQKVDESRRLLRMTDGTEIFIEDIAALEL